MTGLRKGRFENAWTPGTAGMVTGKIDRLCEMEHGSWMVIDYKSKVGSIIESASLIQEYEISIQTYTNAIEQILGIKFINGFLYSTDIGDFF